MKSTCVFTHAQNARAVMKIANKFNQELPRLPALRNVFKFHVMFILANSVATHDRKQFHCLNVFLNNKTGSLFWNSIDAKRL